VRGKEGWRLEIPTLLGIQHRDADGPECSRPKKKDPRRMQLNCANNTVRALRVQCAETDRGGYEDRPSPKPPKDTER
jgi:hypothetical protein